MKLDTKRPAYVVGFAIVTSVAFTACIMGVQVVAQGLIERNERLMGDKALVDIFGLGDVRTMSAREIEETVRRRIEFGSVVDIPTGRKMELIRAYNMDSELSAAHRPEDLVGYAFPISGIGFWDRISGYLAVTPDFRTILGVAFLRLAETPGLGGEIVKPHFRDQFRPDVRRRTGLPPLDASPPAAGGKFLYVGGEKPAGPGDARFGRRVDAITGATGTSTALERFLNADLAAFHRAAEAAGLIVSSPATRAPR